MTNVNDEQLILSSFPKNVIEQAAVAAKLKPASYLSRRLDLRGKTVLSFGDTQDGYSESALSLYRTEQGWQLGVHMADVAEYVCEGSPLDIEARRRRASVRNGFVKIDMLPEAISRELCNLAPSGDKLTLSVLLDIAPDGSLISVKFEESVLRVAERCIYEEIDQYGLAREASSVLALRNKYMPYTSIFADMYELAAMFYNKRLERGALDCPVYRRIFERDGQGNPISFKLELEPDSRAMVREIGYYAAEAIGSYMHANGLPCIFIGQSTVDEYATEYLCNLLNIENGECPCNFLSSEIIKRAKGSPYYRFVCEALQEGLPCAEYSEEPIFNIHCASDKVVSFVRPATRYTDLLAHRAIKASIAASNDPKNINLNRQRAIIAAATVEANNAEKYVYETKRRFYNLSAASYIEYNSKKTFEGFPLLRDESGAVPVLLCCGAKAVVPSDIAKDYSFTAGTLDSFEVIALGTESEAALVKPANRN